MKKILGLDIGTNSIGWALIEKDSDKPEGNILGLGSRIIPMGSDKIDYEKGIAVTKNADRRTARTIRKMNKRYKQRRNKLLFILNELGMLPEQFHFRHRIRDDNNKLTRQYQDGFPLAKNLQDLELLPIKKDSLQLDSLQHYKLRVKALMGNEVSLPELGKILYRFNQLRGYAGGDNENNENKKKQDEEDNDIKKKYEVLTQKVTILRVKKSEEKTFKAKKGKNKGEELPLYDVTILLNDEEKTGTSILQDLQENKEEELEIRIRQTKKGEQIILALPQKTNWRKQMEATEEILTKGIFISQLILNDLKQNKWSKIRNRVFLRRRYKEEFDRIWNEQIKYHHILNNCTQNKLQKITDYLYPGLSESQQKLKTEALNGGIKYIIKDQVIFYQRPLKVQSELIRKCKFEVNETVLPDTHPLFQEFRCWDQINRMYITSKTEAFDQKKKKNVYRYFNRYLTNEQKEKIYSKLQNQKQVGFGEVAKIIELKNDKTEYLNGLNVKAKLKGCDTLISIKKVFKEVVDEDIDEDIFERIVEKDNKIVTKIWKAIFYETGNEYDEKSDKVCSLANVLENIDVNKRIELALKLAQNIKYARKYASLSEKAIKNILPLMQCKTLDIPSIKDKLERINHIIDTGEINDEDGIEDYMIDYVANNLNIIEEGGLMFAFAASLVYGKHTPNNIKPVITNYHEITYNADRNLRNPVVEQILNETMQVFKSIWKQYKINPSELEVRIELARDLKNSADERERIYKGQIKNQKINENIKKRLLELNQEVSQENIELYKLWSKQNIEQYPAKSKEPTEEEIKKLRIWEEQKCISPYTLKPIPLSKLFSSERLYDIDHIIPKSRFFDDSLTNKVVCETNINEEKDNRTAWEYISQQNSSLGICNVETYISHVNMIFFGKKKKNLLLEKIPTDTVERQIKETQYVSIAVKNELAKIVGSDRVKTTTGEVTAFLRSRWGLHKLFKEITEERFKRMELWDWNKEKKQPNNDWIAKYYDCEKQKNIYEIKHWSKRYDHRHHAIDALVVALTEQSHIQRLNNLNKLLQDELNKRKNEFKLEVNEGETVLEAFFNIGEERRKEIQKQIEGFRKFDSPIENLIPQAKKHLKLVTVAHKPKDKLIIQFNKKTGKKELKIRGALHEATFYGKHNGQDTKTIRIVDLTAKDIEKIVDRKKNVGDKDCLKEEIDSHRKNYETVKEAYTGEGLKAFNVKRVENNKPPVYKLKVYYNTKEKNESSLQRLYEDNANLSVKTGDNYLFLVMEKIIKGERKRIFDIVSLYDAVQLVKDKWKENENLKQEICESYRIKHSEKPEKTLFYLQQSDIVYLPDGPDDPIINLSAHQFDSWLNNDEKKYAFNKRVYKVVKFTGRDCFFIPHNFANTISASKDLTDEQKDMLRKKYGEKKIPKQELNFEEFGSFDASIKTEINDDFVKKLRGIEYNNEPLKIQETCIKLKSDWLGNIRLAL